MTRPEFKSIVRMSADKSFKPIPYLSLDVFSGCALDNKRRYVTREQVASLIIGHCYTFAGTWDFSELEELERLSKRFDLID